MYGLEGVHDDDRSGERRSSTAERKPSLGPPGRRAPWLVLHREADTPGGEVLTVIGELDAEGADLVVDEIGERGCPVVLDCRFVTYVGAAGVTALLLASSGSARILASRPVTAMIERCGLTGFVDLVPVSGVPALAGAPFGVVVHDRTLRSRYANRAALGLLDGAGEDFGRGTGTSAAVLQRVVATGCPAWAYVAEGRPGGAMHAHRFRYFPAATDDGGALDGVVSVIEPVRAELEANLSLGWLDDWVA